MDIKVDKKYFDTSVLKLGFTTGLVNVLMKANIDTLGKLINTSEEKLMDMPSFGEVKAHEIRDKVNSLTNDELERISSEQTEEYTGDLADKSIISLGLSVRAYNALSRGGIHTIGELMSTTDEDLLRLHNLGGKTLNEINEAKQKIDIGTITLIEPETDIKLEDEEKSVEDYPKRGFDTEIIKLLKEQFGLKYAWLASWFDITKQAVDLKLKSKKNRGHWRDRELTARDIEDLDKIISSKEYTLKYDDRTVVFLNNKEDNCAIIYVDPDEIKCFFLENLPHEVQDKIRSNKLEFLTEEEYQSYPGGTVFTVLGQSFFCPEDSVRYRRLASARRMNLKDYTMFMFGLPYVNHQSKITDGRINEFLKQNTYNGVTYIQSASGHQWMRNFISRNGFTIDEFIEFYGYKSATTANLEENVDYSDLFGKMDESMDVREVAGNDIENIYAQYPLIGNKIIAPKNLQKIHERAKKLIDDRVLNTSKKFTLQEEMLITLSVVNYAKNWVGESNEKFTRFISAQYGYRDSDGVIRNIVNSCVNDAMVQNNRWFIVSPTGYQYKSTIVAHALTPKNSWDAFFNFLFDFYTNNMNWEYVENDPIIERMIVALGAKFRSGDDDYDESIQISDKVYGFQEGIRKLIKFKPHYAIRVVSQMLQRIDAMINHTAQPPKDYLDVLADEWKQRRIQELSNAGRSRKSATERRVVAIDYTRIRPVYQLQNHDTLLISFPDARMEKSDFRRIVLNVYNGDELVISGRSLEFYGNELGMTMRGFSLDVEKEILRKSSSKQFAVKIVVLCDDVEIYNSGTELGVRTKSWT